MLAVKHESSGRGVAPSVFVAAITALITYACITPGWAVLLHTADASIFHNSPGTLAAFFLPVAAFGLMLGFLLSWRLHTSQLAALCGVLLAFVPLYFWILVIRPGIR